MSRKRVLLLSNGSLLMASVRRLLQQVEQIELECVAICDPEAAVKIGRLAPEVIVLDPGEPPAAMELVGRLLSELPETRVIALNVERKDIEVYRAQRVSEASLHGLLQAIGGKRRGRRRGFTVVQSGGRPQGEGADPVDRRTRVSWKRDELERLFVDYFGHKLSPDQLRVLVSDVAAALDDRSARSDPAQGESGAPSERQVQQAVRARKTRQRRGERKGS